MFMKSHCKQQAECDLREQDSSTSGTRDGRVHTVAAAQSAYTSQDAGRTRGPRLTDHIGISSDICMQDYKSTPQLTERLTDTQLLTGYTISSAR